MNDTGIKLKVTALPDDRKWGVYVWQFFDGGFFANDEGDFMYIASEYRDEVKVDMLIDAAKSYGVFELGFPRFLPGRGPVTDEEFEQQRKRLMAGLDPTW